MAEFQICEGWTEKLVFQLQGFSAIPDGASVSLILKRSDGTAVTTSGKTAIEDKAQRTVSYTPEAGDLVAADTPYTARWQIASGGEDGYAPSGEADVWHVYPQ